MMNKIEEFNVDEYIDKVTETKRIFRQSLEKYGKEPQCRQLMEECAELIKATNKMLRYADRPAEPEYYANLIEEIADVEIMLYQLKVMFNVSDDEVFKVKIQKAKREQERLEKLVKWGDAAKTSNAIVGSYYYVTQKGIDFLSSIYKIKLQPRK